MIIAVWGKAGTGKSLIANELGKYYAHRGKITAVIDTDMTQPTLPPRLPNTLKNKKASLGAIFASPQVRDAAIYLHPHPKEKSLFFSGLTMDDNYLSYEIGMRQCNQAASYVTACQDVVDVIILDCSSQRGDPFLAVALDVADRFLFVHTPNTKHLCWYLAVKLLMDKKRGDKSDSILHVANKVQKHQAAAEYEKAAGIKLSAVLPFSRSINETDGQGKFVSSSQDHQGVFWQKYFNKHLVKKLESDMDEH